MIFPLHKPLPSAKNSIIKLRQCGKRVGFVTNNNHTGLTQLLEKFDQFEYKINLDDLVYPTLAMIDHLKSIDFDKEVYLISFPVMREEFKKAGFKLADLVSN